MVVARPSKQVMLGCHEGLALECWTTQKTKVSRSFINKSLPLVQVWFCESSEAVRLTHEALLNGQELPNLAFDSA